MNRDRMPLLEPAMEFAHWHRSEAHLGAARMGVIYTQGGMGRVKRGGGAPVVQGSCESLDTSSGDGCGLAVASTSLDQGELLALDDLLVQLWRDDVAGRFLARICFNIGALCKIGQASLQVSRSRERTLARTGLRPLTLTRACTFTGELLRWMTQGHSLHWPNASRPGAEWTETSGRHCPSWSIWFTWATHRRN